MVEEKIRNIFLDYPEAIYGFTDIAYSTYADTYQSALVFAVPYGELLTLETYSEERFEKGIQDARITVEEILVRLKIILDESEVKYTIPPAAQSNETDLAAPFSFKFAAVNAGLGWIGKNDVLITQKYGPRVRLSAVLIDMQFTYGSKTLKSNCPEDCRKCVDACPYKALHNMQWNINSLRNEIIDYKLCNEKRSLFVQTLGRKSACGLCMAACPFGGFKMTHEIISLPREVWAGTVIPMRYTTEDYFDVRIKKKKQGEGYDVELCKCKFETPVSHYPEEYDFPDKLYQEHWEKAYAWGIVEEREDGSGLLACIETCPEEWSNRLIITELWVHESLRRQGIGRRLMAIAKKQAVLEHRRAIILETQSCNTGAISFYEQEGFELIGFDSCCYSNRDLERKEVRINMGYILRTKVQEAREKLILRKERELDYHKTEQMVLDAFWNKHHYTGCDEHLLVHKLRDSEVYLPELSRVAVIGEEIVGVICYAKAMLKQGEQTKEILLFGPLCVAPEWQGCGIGGRLLKETLAAAGEMGYEGVVIFGEPDYYPRFGFQTCDHFGITTVDGKNFDAFLGIELVEGGLKDFGGRFIEPEVFENLSPEENEAFTMNF